LFFHEFIGNYSIEYRRNGLKLTRRVTPSASRYDNPSNEKKGKKPVTKSRPSIIHFSSCQKKSSYFLNKKKKKWGKSEENLSQK